MKTISLYRGHRFPAVFISQAVRWYFRFHLSLRDIEEPLFERGVVVSYETIRRWCDKFCAGFAHRIRARRQRARCRTRHPAAEAPRQSRGQTLLSASAAFVPGRRKIVTDQLRSYPAAKADIPALANIRHVFVKAAACLNNRAENSHQPTRERERRMKGFRDPERTQAFLSSFGPIRQYFALKRHLLRASLYRKHLTSRFSTWREFTEVTQNPFAA